MKRSTHPLITKLPVNGCSCPDCNEARELELSTEEIKQLIHLLEKVGRIYSITDAATVAAFVINEARRNGKPI